MARYGLFQVADVTFYDLVTNKPLIFLNSLKISNIENKAATVYAQGGKGNAKILAFDKTKEANIKIQDALITDKTLAMMAGNQATTGATPVDEREELASVAGVAQIANPTVAPALSASGTTGTIAAGTYYVKYTFVNGNGETLASTEVSQAVTAGEILTVTVPALPAGATQVNVYIGETAGSETLQGNTTTTTFTQSAPLVAGASAPTVNGTGTSVLTLANLATSIAAVFVTTDAGMTSTDISSKATQGQTAGATPVTTLTFSTGNVPVGSTVYVYYVYNTGSSAELYTITASDFPPYVKVVGSTVIRNTSSGLDEKFTFVVPKAKIAPNFTLTLQADGNPTVFDMDLEAFVTDTSNELYHLIKH